MKDELVSLQTAKLAKEKGLKLNYCRELFYPDPDKEGEYVTNECSHDWEFIEDKDWYSRPTQSLLNRWLRDVHKYYIDIFIRPDGSYCICNIFNISIGGDNSIMHINHKTYEEALEYGLYYTLNLIKKGDRDD